MHPDGGADPSGPYCTGNRLPLYGTGAKPGTRNDSSNLIYVAEKIGALKGVTTEESNRDNNREKRLQTVRPAGTGRKGIESLAKLGNPQETIQVLQKHDFHFQKKFGQNFSH